MKIVVNDAAASEIVPVRVTPSTVSVAGNGSDPIWTEKVPVTDACVQDGAASMPEIFVPPVEATPPFERKVEPTTEVSHDAWIQSVELPPRRKRNSSAKAV